MLTRDPFANTKDSSSVSTRCRQQAYEPDRSRRASESILLYSPMETRANAVTGLARWETEQSGGVGRWKLGGCLIKQPKSQGGASSPRFRAGLDRQSVQGERRPGPERAEFQDDKRDGARLPHTRPPLWFQMQHTEIGGLRDIQPATESQRCSGLVCLMLAPNILCQQRIPT